MSKVAQSTATDYQDVWMRCLTTFFGWSEKTVAAWATSVRKATHASSKDSLLDHESALFYVRPLCVPPSLRERLVPKTYQRLLADVEKAIQAGSDLNWSDSHFDWAAARDRVNKLLLTKHGEHLPRPLPPK